MDAVLRIQGLRKSFSPGRDALLLRDLDVQRGEFLVVVGPSGAGKSTLVNILGGFIEPDAGQILKDGAPLTAPGPDRMPVFQDHALFPWYTTAENVAYGLRNKGLSKQGIGKRVAEMLELVGLSDAANYYPAQLSGGMSQRAALARAIAPEPEILLLDEPFAALDEGTRCQLHNELLKIWRKYSPTIVMITHNLAEAVLLADRIAILQPPPRGLEKIFKIGIPRKERSRNPAAKALIGQIASLLGAENPELS